MDVKSRALSLGVPEFNISFLQVETKKKFDVMSPKEQEVLIEQWYNHQIPHYESFFYQNKLQYIQSEAFKVGVPQFSIDYLQEETRTGFQNQNQIEQIKTMVKWYEFQMDHYSKMKNQQQQLETVNNNPEIHQSNDLGNPLDSFERLADEPAAVEDSDLKNRKIAAPVLLNNRI